MIYPWILEWLSVANVSENFFPKFVYREQTTTPGTPCPTLCEWCVDSFTSHRAMNIEGL